MTEQSKKALITAVFIIIAAGAFAFRIPNLERRPMHTDEAVHTVKAAELFEEGAYIYDRNDYHGPTIYWAAFPFFYLGGARTFAETDEWMYRIVPVIFGVGLILLIPLLIDGLGILPATVAAILIAVSPAFVFYSRYYIQEMLLVFLTLLFIAAGWRYLRSGNIAWAITVGIAAGLMQATKETSVLAWAAIAVALAVAYAASRSDNRPVKLPRRFALHIVIAVLVALAVAATLLTNFYRNPRAIVEAALTYFAYLDRSHGSTVHDHPFFYYLRMLAWHHDGPGPWWSEGVILALAAVGAIVAIVGRGIDTNRLPFARFLAVYTIALVLIYSAIPYKTPWCALTFLSGMALLGGIGVEVIVRLLRYRAAQAAFLALLAVGIFNLGQQAGRANGRYCADTRNPYVYGHTSANVLKLVKRVDEIAAVVPQGNDLLIKVFTADQWPLPWYFRKYPLVGYWGDVPDNADASIVITCLELQPRVEAQMRQEYQSELYGLRPEVLVTMYIRKDLWDAYMTRKSGGA